MFLQIRMIMNKVVSDNDRIPSPGYGTNEFTDKHEDIIYELESLGYINGYQYYRITPKGVEMLPLINSKVWVKAAGVLNENNLRHTVFLMEKTALNLLK